jgi:hypothetical protein
LYLFYLHWFVDSPTHHSCHHPLKGKREMREREREMIQNSNNIKETNGFNF